MDLTKLLEELNAESINLYFPTDTTTRVKKLKESQWIIVKEEGKEQSVGLLLVPDDTTIVRTIPKDHIEKTLTERD